MSPKRLTQSAAIGLTLAAFAAPATAGAQDLRSPDARDTAPVVRAGQDLRSPDARDTPTPPRISPGTDLRTPDTRDAAEGRGTFNAPDVMVVKVREPAPAAVADGMDWGDAGLGAGVLLAFGALALGGAFAATHRRGTATTV
jgi:hypothetical protein